ncbi:MAG: amidohydrolase family protein [Thermodesulfobacteriota bacterium]|nr:amidohydrolase family protein [Thermodesulfobacteriota bacterium]
MMAVTRRLFHNMGLFDGISDLLQDDKIIITSGDRIGEIGSIEAIDRYQDCERIDLEGKTILPGFIDAHLHITVPFIMEATPKGFLQMNRQLALNFANCVKYGVTTVRDMGAFPKKIIKWRKKIDSGKAPGPRIMSSLSFITSFGGVPEMVPTLNPIESLIAGGQFAERLKTPEEVKVVANRLIDEGANWLKTQYSENSFLFHGQLPYLSDACFDELVEAGKKRNVKVAMHHTERAGFLNGIQVGVNTLEHCATEELDEAEIDRFVAQNMAIIPTLKVLGDSFEVEEILGWLRTKGANDLLSEPLRQSIAGVEVLLTEPYPPPDYEKKFYHDIEYFRRGYPAALKNVEKIKKAGGTVGVGTDSCGTGLSFFGSYWKELRYLTQAGFTNAEALKAATAVNANIIGMADDVGTIEPGKYADFTIIDGNPINNIETTKNVVMVIKGGEIVA